jgi:hypothetical protein
MRCSPMRTTLKGSKMALEYIHCILIWLFVRIIALR